MAEIKMPRMGDAMDEGVIVQWLKNVGDKIGPEDAIMEIETDKSNVEVPAETEGYIQELKYKAGDTVPVGTTVALIGPEPPSANGAGPAAPSASAKPAPAPENAPAPPAASPVTPENKAEAKADTDDTPEVEEGNFIAPQAQEDNHSPTSSVRGNGSRPSVRKPSGEFKPYNSFVGALPEGLGGSASVLGEPIELEDGGGTEGAAASGRVRSTPLARAMAQAHNLNLSALRGSKPGGGITKADVEAALGNVQNGPSAQQAPSQTAQTAATQAAPAAAPAPAASAPAAAEGDEVQEYNAMRRTIAKRLVESKTTIPHFYVTVELDVEPMSALREQVNASAGEGQPKVSFTDMLVKACAVALGENPVANSFFSDNKRIVRKAVNVGIAVSIADGLIVPVVKNCESKSLRAIARETRPLIEKARSGKLTPAEYTGGTFTISNLGQYDVENFAAIINPGEGAILAVSSVREIPVVENGQVVVGKRMKVTLSADHRVMDGVAGAVFLQSLKRVVEDPIQILA